jgi:hypothetical protein
MVRALGTTIVPATHPALPCLRLPP